LNHQDQTGKPAPVLEESEQNRSRDIVREIPDANHFPGRQNRAEIGFQDVFVNHVEIAGRAVARFQPLNEKRIDLDGPDLGNQRRETPGQESETGSDFQNRIILGELAQANDRIEDFIVNQEVLAEALSETEGPLSERFTNLVMKRHGRTSL
jgi:hypothetical protein